MLNTKVKKRPVTKPNFALANLLIFFCLTIAIVVVATTIILPVSIFMYVALVTHPPAGSTNSTPAASSETLSYRDETLGVNFNYPIGLGRAHAMDDARSNQNWHRIDFDKGGFEAGYTEVSASTSNYVPVAGEGSPHYFDGKITNDDSIDSVKSKLEAADFIPVSVEKVKSRIRTKAFRVYVAHCYGPCYLERLYIVPIYNSQFSDVVILSVIGGTYAKLPSNDPLPIDQTKQFAERDANAIDQGTASSQMLAIARGEDIIFNSLLFIK
ncbi:MAG TPA: hypothetical protein VG965_04305 [Patescibacteria group bacterium]|nr:hypothetical protein [Patescibacteria group bacterium]